MIQLESIKLQIIKNTLSKITIKFEILTKLSRITSKTANYFGKVFAK